VSFGIQASLWSTRELWSTGCSTGDGVGFNSLASAERLQLSDGAWVDVRPGWLSGGFELFQELLDTTIWRAQRRQMYDRVVNVPRLLRYFHTGEPVPWPALVEARSLLSSHYRAELGEDFTSTGMCLYRDGQDSVAWHGDTLGRGANEDTIVAIVSLGASRTFALRPRNKAGTESRGAALRFNLGHGDLLVMGGSCQRTWEHAIPKTNARVGPRVSLQFRPVGVS
jgi:alkylated DNA repair dioxygenase AlkB